MRFDVREESGGKWGWEVGFNTSNEQALRMVVWAPNCDNHRTPGVISDLWGSHVAPVSLVSNSISFKLCFLKTYS